MPTSVFSPVCDIYGPLDPDKSVAVPAPTLRPAGDILTPIALGLRVGFVIYWVVLVQMRGWPAEALRPNAPKIILSSSRLARALTGARWRSGLRQAALVARALGTADLAKTVLVAGSGGVIRRLRGMTTGCARSLLEHSGGDAGKFCDPPLRG